VLTDTAVDWWEEQFILTECELRSIAAALQMHSLEISRAIVEDNLRCKVEETRGFRAKLVR
jgi:hypothetical protein